MLPHIRELWLVRKAEAVLPAKRLLRKVKFSVWPHTLDSVEARQLLGNGPLGEVTSGESTWNAPPKRPCQQLTATVQQPLGQSQSLRWLQTPSVLSFPGQYPQAGRPACLREGMNIY